MKNKKTLMHFNEQGFENAKNQLINDVEKINNALQLVKDFTNETITAEDAQRFKENPIEYLSDWVNANVDVAFAFSDFDFKLDMKGIKSKYYAIVEDFRPQIPLWNTLDLIYQNNEFTYKKETIDNLKETFCLYAEDESTLEKFNYFKDLSELLNKGFKEGHLSIYSRPGIVNQLPNLKLDVKPNDLDYSVMPNPFSINYN